VNPFDAAALERLAGSLAGRAAIEIEEDLHRRACVIAPFVQTPHGWALLFCRRSEDLRTHSGQMSFPGGGWHKGESLVHAALRETEEEIGVPSSEIEVIGRLDDLLTISGYVVAPFVGIMRSSLRYVLQQSEVTAVYEVPLDVLLEPRNPEVRSIEFQGRHYPSYFYHHDGPVIWGLTGRMVKSLLDEVRLVI
jgi:8-oxo-dGTP pyrophosphatase MutT (NUDIX family)